MESQKLAGVSTHMSNVEALEVPLVSYDFIIPECLITTVFHYAAKLFGHICALLPQTIEWPLKFLEVWWIKRVKGNACFLFIKSELHRYILLLCNG